jgi:hypothetical protein
MEDFATTVTFQTVPSAAPSTITTGRLWPNESFIVTLYYERSNRIYHHAEDDTYGYIKKLKRRTPTPKKAA